MLLNWQHRHNCFKMETCFSLNFGEYDQNLTIPQILLTPWSVHKLKSIPRSCFIVLVGGKYLNHLGDVLSKLNNVINDVGGTRPLGIFLQTNKNIIVDSDVWQLTPFLVRLGMGSFMDKKIKFTHLM